MIMWGYPVHESLQQLPGIIQQIPKSILGLLVLRSHVAQASFQLHPIFTSGEQELTFSLKI